MEHNLIYRTKEEIILRGRQAVGLTIGEIGGKDLVAAGKGGVGNAVQEMWFGIPVNSAAGPDFEEAGVELKVTPFVMVGGKRQAKERLVCNVIDYMKEHGYEFFTSSFWRKCNTLFLILYEFRKDVAKEDYVVDDAFLFTYPQVDLEIIVDDWEKIVAKIRLGKAHEISEGDTMYLAASTKGANSASLRRQPFSETLAMQRAFSLKQSYMTFVIGSYVSGGEEVESVVRDPAQLKERDFERIVCDAIAPYFGRTQFSLKAEFGIMDDPKNLNEMILGRMLGLRGKASAAVEFRKANIIPKTVRIGMDGTVRENMSFPAFDFNGIVCEDWEDSELRNILVGTKFLFIIFRYREDGGLVFRDAVFWNFPEEDLDEVKEVWERTVRVLKDGVQLTVKGGRTYNDLPKSSESRVAHVRPHALDAGDLAELPDGRMMTKQSFWLNSGYIKEQLRRCGIRL